MDKPREPFSLLSVKELKDASAPDKPTPLVRSPDLERRRAAAARKADKYISADGSKPDLSRLDTIGTLSPIEYGARRDDLAKEMGAPRTFLDAEYKERRKAAAKDAGGDAEFLSDPEPWQDPVDGAELLAEISAAITKHIALQDREAHAIALWAVFTHAHDCFDISPILAATSPTPECGKTTLLRLLHALTPRALSASNISSAAMFRVMDKWGPTLLVDEADTFVKDNDELRGILNCGHDRSGSFVIRNVGDSFEPTQFCTWGPKAIAMIGKLPPTWQSRSIHIQLKRMFPGDHVEPLRQGRTKHLDILKRKARRWTLDHADELPTADPELPESLYGRAADNWRPLVAIADLAGGDWPERARRVAEQMGGRHEDLAHIQVLHDVNAMFEEHGVDRLASTEITHALAQMEDRPWPEWKNSKPITPRQLARLLDNFDIVPINIRLGAGSTPKGYHRKAFNECVKRYPPSQSATPPQALETNDFSDFQSAIEESGVADMSDRKPQKSNGCGGVADTEPQKADTHTYDDPFAALRDPEWGLQ